MAKKIKELTPKQQAANSYIDITEIGPLGYRQLQAANTDPNSEYEQIMNYGAALTANMYENIAPHYTLTPALLGESMFDDEVVGSTEYENLNEIRALRLPWYAKLSAGVAKGAVLAGTTFLDGTIGLITGIEESVRKGNASLLWDNPFSQLMLQINEESEKLMPNYYTKEELESPWYENIFTANFLGDKLIKNLGFTVGAFYSGNVYSNLLKMTKIPLIIGTLSRSVQAPKHIISGTGAVLSAINEGRIEALNNSNDWFKYQKQLLDDVYTLKFKDLEDVYGDTEMYNILRTQLQEDYNKSLAKISEDRTKMGNADLLMNLPILTASNVILFGKLYGNGFKTARKTNGIYGKLGELKTSANENLTRKSVLKGLGVSASEGAEEISQKAASTISGKAYEQDLNNYYASLSDPTTVDNTIDWIKAFNEGMIQTLGEEGTWEEGFIGALTGALGMPMFRSIRNREGKLQSPITIEGGIRGAFKEISELAAREQEVVDYINNRVQDPKFKDMWKHMVRHNFYDNQMLQDVANNDEFNYKNNETALMINDIEMFDNAGKLEDLKALVLEGVNLSDEDVNQLIDDTSDLKTADTTALKELIEELLKEILEITLDFKRKHTTLKDRKHLRTVIDAKKLRLNQLQEEVNNPKKYYVGPFIDENGNKKSVEEVRKKLKENADLVIRTINSYVKFKDNLDVRTNEALTDDLLSTLTYLGVKSDDWKLRNSLMFEIIKPYISNILGLEEVNNGIDLGQLLKKNPVIKDNIKDIIDNEAPNALDAQSLKNIVNDIIKTSDGVLDFNRKLEEYLNNPQKITEHTQRVHNQRIEEQKSRDSFEELRRIDLLNTFGAVENEMNEASELKKDINYEEIYKNSLNPTVQNFNNAVRFRNEVINAIDKSNADNDTKTLLKSLIDKRFNSIGDYDLLVNPNENAEEEGTSLGQYIQIANNVINNNPSLTGTLVDDNNIPPVVKTETGNDGVSTTPLLPTDVTEAKGLNDLLNIVPENSDIEGFNDNLNKLKESTLNALTLILSALKPVTPNEAALSTALKIVKELKIIFNNLNLGEDFNKKAEDFFNRIEDAIQKKMYAIDNSNANENEITLDNSAESSLQRPHGDNGQKNYLRGNLTEFTIDSFNDGTFEKFPDKYPDYKSVWDKILFDYINKGNIRIGDTIELKLEPTEINGKTYETVYMYHNGNIVGVLPSVDKTQYTGILDVYRLLREGKQLSTTVSDIMLGKFPYTRNERRPLHKIKGVGDAGQIKLGIMTRGGMVTNDKDLDNNTENVFDLANSTGKVYILLKNSKGTYSPKRVVIKRFNNREFPLVRLKDEGNPVAIRLFNMLDLATKVIIDGIRTNNMDKAYNAMDSLYSTLFKDLVLLGFHMDLVLNHEDGSSYLQFRIGDNKTFVNIAEIHDGQAHFNLNEQLLFDTILNQIQSFNPVFNINLRRINNPAYNKEIIESGLLESYISDSLMVGSWFITNYIDANGNEIKANKPSGTFNPPVQPVCKSSYNDSEGNLYTFYIYIDGATEIYKSSVVDGKEVTTEITMDMVPVLLQELFKAYVIYGDTKNGPNQINGLLLIERDGKQYVLDRNKQRFLSEEQTKTFIKQLNEKNNPTSKTTSTTTPITTSETTPSTNKLEINIITNSEGKKEALVKLPKELLSIAKPLGSIDVDDVKYPIIIIERPNGNNTSNYSILLPNGQETNFGMNSLNNLAPNIGMALLMHITKPENVAEVQQVYKDNLTPKPVVLPLDSLILGSLTLTILPLSASETKPVETDDTITDDDLLDIMDVSVHDVPIDKLSEQKLDLIVSESNVQSSPNVDLDYDNNIDLLQMLSISRETWESMPDESKLSTLGCQ